MSKTKKKRGCIQHNKTDIVLFEAVRRELPNSFSSVDRDGPKANFDEFPKKLSIFNGTHARWRLILELAKIEGI